MNSKELKLAATLLRIASEEFSRHGCNDLDLGEFGFSIEEAKEFVREAYIANDPQKGLLDFNETVESHHGDARKMMPDWWAMDHLAEKIQKLEENWVFQEVKEDDVGSFGPK